MMFIAGAFTGNVVNAANHYDKDSNKVIYEKPKEYKPKKSKKKPTIFGYEIEKVKLR